MMSNDTIRVSGIADHYHFSHPYLLRVFHSFGNVDRLYLSKGAKLGTRIAVVKYHTHKDAANALDRINYDRFYYCYDHRWNAQWARRKLPAGGGASERRR